MTKRLLLLPGVFAFCAARALGMTMKKSKLAWALGFAAIALWAVVVDVNDNTVFELDGDAIHNTTPGNGHDWDQVYADSQAGNLNTSQALAISFDPDVTNTTADNIFQGGGSKDNLGIQSGQWLWTNSKPQGKDDIAHAYAAAYNIPSGCGTGVGQTPCHLAIYFGVDRYDNSGDSTMGFWFFQDGSVGLTNTKKGGGFTFSGSHRDGDLLIIADFTIGGSTSTPVVYRWTGNDASGSLTGPVTLAPGSAFVVVNTGGQSPGGWSFTDKSGNHTFAHGEFLEGGLDLTANNLVACISKFMAETRSSQSPSATLSDFTPPRSFPLCGLHVTKACGTASAPSTAGGSFSYPVTGTVQNTGALPLYLASVTDVVTHSNNLTETLTLTPTPTTIGAGQIATWSTTLSDPGLQVSDTATASANTASDGTGESVNSDNSFQATCAESLETQLSITKNCGIPQNWIGTEAAVPGTSLIPVSGSNTFQVQVAFSGQVCNSGDTAINTISLSDFQGSSSSAVTVTGPTSLAAAGGTCTTDANTGVTTCSNPTCLPYQGTYLASGIDFTTAGSIGPGRYFFNDLIAITGATATQGTLAQLQNTDPKAPFYTTVANCNATYGCTPASCPLCSTSGECTTGGNP